MNYKMISYIVGWVMVITAALMLLPLLLGAIYRENTIVAFGIGILFSMFAGILLTVKKPQKQHFSIREGFITVALSWVILSLIGSIPFVISGVIPNPVDALFETVSGFTTTGASILTEVESVPKSILFWRSFTHWIGGMGVLVFLLSLLRMTGGSHVMLMKAESPGPSVSKLVPKVNSTAKILYQIYLGMTIVMILVLLLCGMPLFDAVVTGLGTAGTGGFGIKNDSIGGYSPLIQVVVGIFMILFGVNFNVYFLMLEKKWKQALKTEELRWYFGIMLFAILTITINIRGYFPGIGEALRQAFFQVTSTGFGTTDFNLWPEYSRTILVMLMFIGACAGSTGGGIKVARIMILAKSMTKELAQYLHPHQVRKIQMDKKPVEHETVRNVNVFLSV